MLLWTIYQVHSRMVVVEEILATFCKLFKHKAIQAFCDSRYFMAVLIQLLLFSMLYVLLYYYNWFREIQCTLISLFCIY